MAPTSNRPRRVAENDKKKDKSNDSFPLGNLPKEVVPQIVKLLDPVDSVCLGLTCKGLYQIHRSIHGTVPLTTLQSYSEDVYTFDCAADFGRYWGVFAKKEDYYLPITIRPHLFNRLWSWYSATHEYFSSSQKLVRMAWPEGFDPRRRSVMIVPEGDRAHYWGEAFNWKTGRLDRFGDRDFYNMVFELSLGGP